MKEKVELRQTLRAKRQSLNEADRNRKSLAIANQLALLDSWPASKGIAVYSPADGEIDPKYITAAARACGKAVFLPIVNKEGKLDFAQWREEDRLVFNRFKILEPSCASPYENTDEISIIFLPLVGWDRSGNRLGMGGGFVIGLILGVGLVLGVVAYYKKTGKVPPAWFPLPPARGR